MTAARDSATEGTTEAEIQHSIRLALGREPDFRLFRNSTGVAQRTRRDGRKSFERHGLAKGSSDLVGILAPSGRWVALEVKSQSGRPTEQQLMWLGIIRNFGGFAAIVRSVDDARRALDRARQGLCE